MKFNYRTFAKAIIDYRFEISYKRRKNMGLRELSKKLNTSPSTLSRIINGKKADIDSILLICSAINKPITNFIR